MKVRMCREEVVREEYLNESDEIVSTDEPIILYIEPILSRQIINIGRTS